MTNTQEGEDLVSGLINSDGEFVDWDLASLGDGDQKPFSDDKVLHQNASEKNKQHHENQTNVKHRCKLCGKEFGSLSSFSRHKKNHRGVKTFECVHCGKRFAHQNALKVHIAIHAKRRPSPCPVSGKPGRARSHNNTHTKKPTGTTSGVEEGDEAVSGFINSDGEDVEWDPSTYAVDVNWTGDQQIDASSTRRLRSDVSGNDFDSSQSSLSRNERDHTKDRPYQCVRCGLRFRFHHNLKKHVRNHLTKKILTRTRCRMMALRETRGRTSLGENKERDELKEEGRTPTQGEASDAETSDDEGTTTPAKPKHTRRLRPRKRRRKEDSGDLFSCEDCDKKFRSVYTRDRHLREKHDKNLRHKCSDCEKTFRANRSLMVHRRIYHPSLVVPVEPQEQSRVPKKHLCSTCGKEFPTSASLSRHLIIHSGKRPYKCPVCGRGFTQIGNLKTHQKVHKGVKPTNDAVNEKSSATPDEAPLSVGICICPLCWTQFSEKGLLEEHMKQVHESKKPYACTECSKRFTNVQKLKEHQAGHEGVKPHQCTQCEKGFQTPQGLENHMRDHTGEKPFPCTICGKRFKQASTLRAHYITHSGERPYLCSICGKSYTRAEELKVHLRVHTGEKPYQCDECGKSFYYRQGFNNHKKTHNAKPIGPTRQLGRPRQQGSPRKASKTKRIPRRRVPDSDGEEDLTWEPPNLGDSPNHHPGSQENLTAPDHSQISQWSYDQYTSFNPWGQHPNTSYWRGTEAHQQYYGPGEPSMSFSALLRSTTDEEQVQDNCIAWRSAIPLVPPPSEHGLGPSDPLNTTSQKPDSSKRTTEMDDCPEESTEDELERETTQDQDQQTSSPLGDACCEKTAVQKTHKQAEEKQPEERKLFQGTRKPRKTYDCPTCGKVFSNNTGLGRHLVIHTGKRPFNCSLCGKGFTQSGNLKTHMKVHKGEVPTDAELQESIPEPEEPAVTFHVCGDCGMDFPEKKQLEEHQKVHDKPYACPHCDKRFKNEYYFKIHKRLHTGDTPFLCSECGKSCVTLDVLKKHELTHTGEKKFHCDQCGRAFMQSAHLYVHLKTHTGERPHLCSICGKSYSKACDLKVHLRVHTGEKPYTCETCGKCFYYSQGYRAHLKTHEKKPKRPTKTLGRPKQKSLTDETDD